MEHKDVSDLNPKSQPVKSLEMAVYRSLQIIEAFDLLEAGQDWSDVPATTYRKILGHQPVPSPDTKGYALPLDWSHGDKWYDNRPLLLEYWKRYQDGTLYRQVLDLHANLPPSVQERKEIADGIRRISERPAGRGKGPAVRTNARRRSR